MTAYHNQLVARLRSHGHWLVDASPQSITLVKKVGTKKHLRVMKVVLSKERDGTYTILPFTYEFQSIVSHFDYNTHEDRWARNKGLFSALVKTLKDVKMWDFIKNKEFIKINTNNPRTNKAQLKAQLRKLF